jgi:hypothetical protein
VSAVDAVIAAELAAHLPAPVTDFARIIAARLPGSAAVLFYGSCLRTGRYWDGLLDFYILVDDYKTAYGRWLPAWGNAALPPNVFYAEHAGADGQTLRCKYAVMTMTDFERWCAADKKSPYIWARFAQPAALVWSRDADSTDRATCAVQAAVLTLVGQTAPAIAYPCDIKTFWSQMFALTYATEFRAERAGKGGELFELFAERYTQLTPHLLIALALPLTLEGDRVTCQAIWPDARILSGWAWRGLAGRVQHLGRLIKAAFTFDGGVDYLAWKITRHSGQAVVVTDWQRRHPILGSIPLFFQLKRRGAIR